VRRALDLVRNVLRRKPATPSIVCSNCGEPALEGLGDPEVERICIACAVLFRARCTDGDAAACARLEALNPLAT
jgi:hypothetical protein